MTKEEAEAIYYQGKETVVAKLLEYDVRLIKLEEMLGLNIKNSSKPSSTYKLSLHHLHNFIIANLFRHLISLTQILSSIFFISNM